MATNATSFRKGRSGNPAGKAPGTRNRITRALDTLLDGEATEITRKAVELAKGGDLVAIRLVLDRVAPPRRDRRIEFPMPDIVEPADAVKASAAIVKAVSEGELSPSEAEALSKLVANAVTTIEVTQLAARISKLEEAAAKR